MIEAEREKRDFLERIEQEAQSGRQSAKKLEKVKRDLDKMGADSAQGWGRWWWWRRGSRTSENDSK